MSEQLLVCCHEPPSICRYGVIAVGLQAAALTLIFNVASSVPPLPSLQRTTKLFAPTSPEQTWGSDAHRVILASLNHAAARLPIDRSRILLTGRSDGATWCYNVGLRYPEVFRAIAPAAGSFWPLARLHARRSKTVAVYIYHGASDPIFPVSMARKAAALLRRTGHRVTYREDGHGGHEYTPEEARRIAEWFDQLPPK